MPSIAMQHAISTATQLSKLTKLRPNAFRDNHIASHIRHEEHKSAADAPPNLFPNMANVLITGGSGYLGGDLLSYLNKETPLPAYGVIYALVRGEEQARKIKEHYNVTPLILELGDQDSITSALVEKKISIVLFMIDAFKADGQLKFIEALSQVSKQYNVITHLVHTSGAKLFSGFVSMPTDRPLSDADPGLFDLQLNAKPTVFPAATIATATNCTVIKKGEELGVRTYVFVPCIVYGESASFGNKVSIQTKCIVKAGKALRRVVKPDDTNGAWPVCHVRDNSTLYAKLLASMLQGKDIPHNKNGYYLASPGSLAWIDIYSAAARALAKRGIIDSAQVAEADDASLAEAAKALDVPVERVTFEMGGICALRADNGSKAGWRPERTPEHLIETMDDEVELLLKYL